MNDTGKCLLGGAPVEQEDAPERVAGAARYSISRFMTRRCYSWPMCGHDHERQQQLSREGTAARIRTPVPGRGNNLTGETAMTTEEEKNLWETPEQKNAVLEDDALEGVSGGVNFFNKTVQEELAWMNDTKNKDREP